MRGAADVGDCENIIGGGSRDAAVNRPRPRGAFLPVRFDYHRTMESRSVVASLAALAQETRLAIYRLLVEAGPGGLRVGQIASEVKTSPATLSFHLKELANAGLVHARPHGRYLIYAAQYEQMNRLLAYLTENCCAREGCCTSAPERRRARRASPAL
jgi:ArsR family transcriptional regulator